MARALTPQDACAIVTAILKQATGQADLAAVDVSNFVSAGETILATGMENTLNAISSVMGRTWMAVRPYDAKLQLFNAENTGIFTHRSRKISFYAKNPKVAGDWNTNLYTNFAQGYDNGSNSGSSTASMWEQNPPVPIEFNFAGSSVWQDVQTFYPDQIQMAFRSPEDFAGFWSAATTEKMNDIESQKEAFNRMAMLNRMAGQYDLKTVIPGSVVNLTAAFNDRFGTSYTSEQLRTTYLKDFLAFFVSYVKILSNRMELRSTLYHWDPTKTVGGEELHILRHTPKSRQKMVLYRPLFTEAESLVLPEIFNDQYLKVSNYEGVDYWQEIETPSAINVTPAIPDTTQAITSVTQIAGTAVNLSYVVGMIFDTDGIMTDFQFESARSTVLEARKNYYNTWYSFSKNIINDFTENAILFTMED